MTSYRVTLKAVLVVDDDILHLQRADNDILNIIEELFVRSWPTVASIYNRRLRVSHLCHVFIILVPVFLYGHVCQVHKHVVQVG